MSPNIFEKEFKHFLRKEVTYRLKFRYCAVIQHPSGEETVHTFEYVKIMTEYQIWSYDDINEITAKVRGDILSKLEEIYPNSSIRLLTPLELEER